MHAKQLTDSFTSYCIDIQLVT